MVNIIFDSCRVWAIHFTRYVVILKNRHISAENKINYILDSKQTDNNLLILQCVFFVSV